MLDENQSFIFKMMPITENTLKLLIKKELWFGMPNILNDPFECHFSMEFIGELPNDEYLKEYYKNELEIDTAIIERIQRNKTNVDFLLKDIEASIHNKVMTDIGICSFTKKYNDIKMWSHYANSHKGICLVFDKVQLMNSSNFLGINESEIEYVKVLPKVEVFSDRNKIVLKGDDLLRIITSKLNNWFDEEEIRYTLRLFNKYARRSIPFDPLALKAVIFGEKIDFEDAGTIYHLLKNENIDWYKSVKNTKRGVMDMFHTHPQIHNGYNTVTI